MPDTEVIEPSEDIVALARTWLFPSEPLQQQAFFARLTKRREEIVSVWRKSPALHRWAARAETWAARA